jgi:SMC interacting uncharacterized protein involved in chromosome segregation
MTIESLTSEIALTREEFRALNDLHWQYVEDALTHRKKYVYRGLLPDMEHRIVELAERLERLHRFRAMLTARTTNQKANGK